MTLKRKLGIDRRVVSAGRVKHNPEPHVQLILCQGLLNSLVSNYVADPVTRLSLSNDIDQLIANIGSKLSVVSAPEDSAEELAARKAFIRGILVDKDEFVKDQPVTLSDKKNYLIDILIKTDEIGVRPSFRPAELHPHKRFKRSPRRSDPRGEF